MAMSVAAGLSGLSLAACEPVCLCVMQVYVWRGLQCMHSMLEAGVQAAARLSCYEGAPAAQVVQQGALGPHAGREGGCFVAGV